MARFFFTLLILSSLTSDLYSQGHDMPLHSADSTEVTADTPLEEEDFSIGLAFLMLVGAGFTIACFGAGVVLMVLVLILIAGLISFWPDLCIDTCGTIQKIFYWWSEKFAVLSGIGFGLLSGLMLGFAGAYIIQKVTAYFKNQFA